LTLLNRRISSTSSIIEIQILFVIYQKSGFIDFAGYFVREIVDDFGFCLDKAKFKG
jgi:hypothetical protein